MHFHEGLSTSILRFYRSFPASKRGNRRSPPGKKQLAAPFTTSNPASIAARSSRNAKCRSRRVTRPRHCMGEFSSRNTHFIQLSSRSSPEVSVDPKKVSLRQLSLLVATEQFVHRLGGRLAFVDNRVNLIDNRSFYAQFTGALIGTASCRNSFCDHLHPIHDRFD